MIEASFPEPLIVGEAKQADLQTNADQAASPHTLCPICSATHGEPLNQRQISYLEYQRQFEARRLLNLTVKAPLYENDIQVRSNKYKNCILWFIVVI